MWYVIAIKCGLWWVFSLKCCDRRRGVIRITRSNTDLEISTPIQPEQSKHFSHVSAEAPLIFLLQLDFHGYQFSFCNSTLKSPCSSKYSYSQYPLLLSFLSFWLTTLPIYSFTSPRWHLICKKIFASLLFSPTASPWAENQHLSTSFAACITAQHIGYDVRIFLSSILTFLCFFASIFRYFQSCSPLRVPSVDASARPPPCTWSPTNPPRTSPPPSQSCPGPPASRLPARGLPSPGHLAPKTFQVMSQRSLGAPKNPGPLWMCHWHSDFWKIRGR